MEEDERREAAIASAASSLQPNFMPKKNKITTSQLSKFHELHKRRLQIKAKSEVVTKKKTKGQLHSGVEGNGKSHEKESNASEHVDKGSSVPLLKGGNVEENSGVQGSLAAAHPDPVSATKRQKKLHWGLDTKERWEMKANM